jgi:hypothetical protein
MATFLLVHGTLFFQRLLGTKAAHWPKLQDSLTETARAAGEVPLLEHLQWTGRNRASARQDAASAIFTSVKTIQRTCANEKIFIIGHSHGGSAIAYFLKEHPEASKTLAGCAFLSTPFVAIRPRRDAIRLISVLLFFPFIAFASLWIQITSPYRGIPITEVPQMSIMEEVQAHLFALFGLGVVAAIICLAVVFLRRAVNPQKLEQSIRQQTADIPAGNYLFLRCSGDEAAAALSAAQFIAWLGMKVSKILELLTRPFFDVLSAMTAAKGFSRATAVRYIVVSVVYYAVLASIAYGWFNVLPDIVKFGVFGYFFSPDGPFLGKLIRIFSPLTVSNFVHMTTILGTFVSFVVVCLLLFCLLAALLIFFTQALTSWVFGWTRLSTGFVVELAIEPLPFGEHRLVHIDWTAAGSIGLEGKVHSWTYAHQDAIKCLQNWVRESLGKSPMNVAEPPTIRP